MGIICELTRGHVFAEFSVPEWMADDDAAPLLVGSLRDMVGDFLPYLLSQCVFVETQPSRVMQSDSVSN